MIDDADNRMIPPAAAPPARQHPRKKYRLKIAYGPYAKGQVIEPIDPLRSVLLQRGVIEPVEQAPQALLLTGAPINRQRRGGPR
jgi:hypothetical protein